jgi:hypothetical protein
MGCRALTKRMTTTIFKIPVRMKGVTVQARVSVHEAWEKNLK